MTAETCTVTTVSNKMSDALRGLQYRVRSGKDMIKIKEDINRLRFGANCHEEKILRAVLLEAEAFSRTPSVALPALDILKNNTAPTNPRYGLVLRALGKNYAIEGRAPDLEALIQQHPNAPGDITRYWWTSLALIYAQHGALDQAIAVTDTFMREPSPSPSMFQVAIVVYEVAQDSPKVAQLTFEANALYGELVWPEALPGMGDQKFEVLYRHRFDPALSDVTPLYPPIPTYPKRALKRGKEGSCDVRFDVSQTGKPFNVEAICSSKLFKKEAERAVSDVRFAPLEYKGQTYVRQNMNYPLEFAFGRRR